MMLLAIGIVLGAILAFFAMVAAILWLLFRGNSRPFGG